MTASGTMKLGLYFRNDDVRVVERPIPLIGSKEVLVRVEICGICGSDTMQWYREPATREKGGINTGHEIAGQIVQAGEGVTRFHVGDRVIVVHHFPCGECPPCQDGNETACEAMREKQVDPGGFSQYMRIFEKCVEKGLYPLPDTMTYEQGSFVEPLGCVMRSLRKAGEIADRTVLVIGSGLAGLLHIQVARLRGAARIFAVDTNAARLRAAVKFGADEAIPATEPLPLADRVFVCAASAKAAAAALQCVNRGGRIVFYAAEGPDNILPIPLTRFWFQQPTISFSYGVAPRDLLDSIELLRTGKIRVEQLVTHRFGIDRIAEAFATATNLQDGSLKVIVEPNRE